MKILLIPIDERPCNYKYPQRLNSKELSILVPPFELLGNKKNPADTEKLWRYIDSVKNEVDGFVLSVEMLLYGGLIPSRLHTLPKNRIKEFIEKVRSLKKKTGKPIYFSSMIMRNQQSNYNDEEPDYYLEYGTSLFKRSVFIDKQEQGIIKENELKSLRQLNQSIPTQVISDLESRRTYNLQVTKELLQLVEESVIDFLVIPQDDSYPYGYTARDQRSIMRIIDEMRLFDRVMIYPGADEVGITLCTRIFHIIKGISPKVYVEFSSVLGPSIVPLYEDRVMDSSLMSHLLATNTQRVPLEEADYIIYINAPGTKMEEAFVQREKYCMDVNNPKVVNAYRIKQLLAYEKPLALVDKAYVNGGDIGLVEILDKLNILKEISVYKSWNTYCNSLGNAIGDLVLSDYENLQIDLVEGLIYQSIVRWELVDNDLTKLACDYFDISNNVKKVEELSSNKLAFYHNQLFRNTFSDIASVKVKFPWERMFEIDIVSIV